MVVSYDNSAKFVCCTPELQRDPAFKKVDFKKVRHCFSEKILIL